MKWLLGITVAAALAWCAYWFIGAAALERGLTAWFEDRRAEGWQAEWSELTVRGFPNRLDTTLEDPVLVDPETGLGWQAPFFQILSLSYQPNDVRLIFPNTQDFLTLLGSTRLDSSKMQGTLNVAGRAQLPLVEANIIASDLEFTTHSIRSRAQHMQFAVRAANETPNSYDLWLEALALAPPVALKRRLDPGDLLPPALETLRLDAVIQFDREWDLRALEERRPQPTAITLNEARAAWGPLGLRATGALDIDAQGRATGEITVKATNWREILSLAERSGLVPQSVIPLLETGLQAIAELSGPDSSIDVPLGFRDGQMRLGFLTLGPAPRFVLR